MEFNKTKNLANNIFFLYFLYKFIGRQSTLISEKKTLNVYEYVICNIRTQVYFIAIWQKSESPRRFNQERKKKVIMHPQNAIVT